MVLNEKYDYSKTISNISRILEHANIIVDEIEWNISDDFLYSVALGIRGLPGVQVNGRGITKENALASAYGELMERLQARVLVRPFYATKCTCFFQFYDEKIIEYDGINMEVFHPIEDKVTKETMKELFKRDEKYRIAGAFYDIQKASFIYVPTRVIGILCRTNGLSAGNTFKEALVRGLSEVIERHVHKKIFEDQISLPDVDANIITTDVLATFRNMLEKRNLTFRIKDCSLGGKYPVLGVLVTDKNREYYRFSLACDLNINDAFVRSVTEMFQGVKLDDDFIKNYMRKLTINKCIFNVDFSESSNLYSKWFEASLHNGGEHPISIFCEQESKNINETFKEPSAIDEYWVRLKNIIQEQGLNIYIKDYSILGFPTVRVYVPGMSEIEKITPDAIDYYTNHNKVIECIMNIYDTDMCLRNSNEYVEILDRISKITKFKKLGLLRTLPNIILKHPIDLFNMDYDFYLGLFLNSINRNDSAAERFKKAILKSNTDNRLAYLMYLLCANKQDSESFKTIGSLLPTDVFEYVIESFENNCLFECFSFPMCPDCEECCLNGNCQYENWNLINNYLEGMAKSFNCKENIEKRDL